MVEAVMLWNEPNNLSHWDFKSDPEWKAFAQTAIAGAKAIRRVNPGDSDRAWVESRRSIRNFMQLMGVARRVGPR